jgi:hypothetical protein
MPEETSLRAYSYLSQLTSDVIINDIYLRLKPESI